MNTTHPLFARLRVGARLSVVLKRCLLAAVLSSTLLHAQLPSPWQAQDIGNTGETGAASHNAGTFTLEGAGDDIWNTSDQFHFAYQNLRGDFTIVARVQSVENTYAWAKAGVMIRETLDVGSKYAFAFMTPSTSNGGKFEYRDTTNGSSATGAQFASTSVPRWVRVSRVGDTFSAAQSADGSSWTAIGSAQTIAMNSSVYIGLAVCSSVTGDLCTAVFTDVSLTNGLPGSWFTEDVGDPELVGGASHGSGTFTIEGAGAEVYGTADEFRYVYQTLTGDCTIIARVASVENTNQWAKVGVMVRKSTADDDQYVFLCITPDQPSGTDRGILFEKRVSSGGSASKVDPDNTTGITPPRWLKLVRSGNTFTGSYSSDGSSWTTIAETATDVVMTGPVLVGLAVCSHASPAALNTSTFDNVSITGDTTAPTVSVSAPTSGAFLRGTSVEVSAIASDNVGVGGVQFKLDGANLGAEDTSPPYSIAWDTTTASNGAHTLTAVARDAATNSTVSSGVSVTVDNAAPSVAITAPSDSATVSGGSVTLSANASDNIGVVGVQFQLDSANFGSEDTSSPFELNWDTTLVQNGGHTIGAVARDAAGNTTAASTVNVTVSNSLPTGWDAADIGSGGVAGSTNYSGGTFIIDGAGENIWNTADDFHFARQSISGDYTVIARVTSVENTHQWAKAGVMIRESLDADSKYVYVLMTPNNGLLFEARSTTGGSSTQPGAVNTIDPPQWVRLVRTGNSFAAAYSSNGTTWMAVPGSPVTVSMSSNVYAGLAVTSIDDNTLCTATFDNVSITEGGGVGTLKTAFPRLGGYNIGQQDYHLTSYQQQLARLDVLIVGFYRGWQGGTSAIRSALQAIKAINPNIFVGNYTLLESSWAMNNPANEPLYQKLYNETGPTGNGGTWTPNDWWAHTTGGSPRPLVDTTYSYLYVTNITGFVTPDANGDRVPQWFARWYNQELFDPVPEFDFWYMDNFFWRPRWDDVDWDRDGSNDSKDDPDVRTYYRQGIVDHVNKVKELRPGMLIMGNVDGTSHNNTGMLRESQYQDLIGGALYESALGRSWSEETGGSGWGKWYNMMASYRSLIGNTAEPHLVVVTVASTSDGKSYDTNTQSTYGGGAAYAFMRYALASVLMDDGYIHIHQNSNYGPDGVVWFDEYDLAGTSTTGWLGAAIDPPQTTPYQNGIFRRRFENGMAIVNPRHNADGTARTAQTITPESGYKRFVGTQAPSVNNGANVTSLTIEPGDGILLVKQ